MRHRFLKSALLGAAAIGAIGFAGGVARADTLSIGYAVVGTSTGITTIATSSAGTVSLPGSLYPVNSGQFFITQLGGTGTPLLSEPTLLTNTTSISAATEGEIQLYVTEQGLTMPSAGYSLLTTFTNNGLLNASVVLSDYYDTTNKRYGMANTLSTASFTSAAGVAGLGTNYGKAGILPLGSPFSLTVVYDVTFKQGGGYANMTIDTSAVPEPGSLALLGTGLLGLGLISRRRRRKA